MQTSEGPVDPPPRGTGRGNPWIAGLLAVLLIMAANVAWVALQVGVVQPPEAVSESDHYRYLAMARGPQAYASQPLAHEPPFCYRLLVPWAAFMLTKAGLGLNLSFYLLTQLCIGLFLYTLFLYLMEAGLDVRFSLLGIAIAGTLQGAVRWYAYQYWMTDPAALFLLTLALLLIRKGRDTAFFCLSPVAVLVRETFLVMFPYYFLHHVKRSGFWRATALAIRAAAGPLLVFLVVRAYIIPDPPAQPFPSLVRDIMTWRAGNLLGSQLYFCTIGSLGVLIPLLLVRPVRTVRHFVANYEDFALVLMIVASLSVAYNTDRLLVYALPALLPPALKNAESFLAAGLLSFRTIAAAILAAQLLLFSLTGFTEPAISVTQPTNPVVTFGMALLLALGALRLAAGRRRPPAGAPAGP